MYGDLQQNTETRRIPVGQISYSSIGGVSLFNGIAQYICELLSRTFTDVPAISQLCLYTSTFTGSDVMNPLRRSTALCVLRASCHAAVIRRIIRNYRFETLNFDAELERTYN